MGQEVNGWLSDQKPSRGSDTWTTYKLSRVQCIFGAKKVKAKLNKQSSSQLALTGGCSCQLIFGQRTIYMCLYPAKQMTALI